MCHQANIQKYLMRKTNFFGLCWELVANVVCGFEFVLSCLYEAGQEGKAKLKKLMKNVVLNVTFLHLFGMFLWAFQDEKVYVETIILVLRSCKLVEARWSCGHLCEDFWFSSKKYHLKCCPGLTHYKKILQFVHVAGLLGGLVDWLGQKSFGMYQLYLVLEKQFCDFC